MRLLVCVLLAMLGFSSCATFNRADAVATVNGVTLSRSDLAAALKSPILQNALQLPAAIDRTDQSSASTLIDTWVVLNALDRSGAVDLTGDTERAALAKQFPNDFPQASPAVQRLAVQYTAFRAKIQAGGLDRVELLAAVQAADIHVDSRYGYWDATAAAIRPFGSG